LNKKLADDSFDEEEFKKVLDQEHDKFVLNLETDYKIKLENEKTKIKEEL